MSDSGARHLVTVWNPSYGADVMESHIMAGEGAGRLTSGQPLARRDGLRDLQPTRARGKGCENKEIEGNAGIARLELCNTRLARLEPTGKGLLGEPGAHTPDTNML
jgi:hypothetical protein